MYISTLHDVFFDVLCFMFELRRRITVRGSVWDVGCRWHPVLVRKGMPRAEEREGLEKLSLKNNKKTE